MSSRRHQNTIKTENMNVSHLTQKQNTWDGAAFPKCSESNQLSSCKNKLYWKIIGTRSDNTRSHQSKAEQLPRRAWHCGRLSWKSITENDSCFPRFVGAIPSCLLLPHQECRSNQRKCNRRIVYHRQAIDTKMNTNKYIASCIRRTSWQAATCNKWHIGLNTRELNSQPFRNPQPHMLNRKHTHTHRNSSKAGCAQSIVVTIIQHMRLICPWQFPSRSGDGLQREIEQSRGGHMTSLHQTVAATNTQDKCQHFDQSNLLFCFYQHKTDW